MVGSAKKSIVTYELLDEFYSKKKEIEKLEKELREMRDSIVLELRSNGMFGGRVREYTYYIEPCRRPTEDFISVMKESGFSDLIKESCSMKDFDNICNSLSIENKEKYLKHWFDKFYVKKNSR